MVFYVVSPFVSFRNFNVNKAEPVRNFMDTCAAGMSNVLFWRQWNVKFKTWNAVACRKTIKKGFIMCGYLNMETAEKFHNIAAIATGVKNIDDMLKTNVVKTSTKAKEAGITEGMPVTEALEML